MASTVSQMPLSLSSHNNQSLFSDHYLDDILRRSDAWRSAILQAQAFLADINRQHKHRITRIIALATNLNQQVYALFHLTPEEIQFIETSTKYNYGEV